MDLLLSKMTDMMSEKPKEIHVIKEIIEKKEIIKRTSKDEADIKAFDDNLPIYVPKIDTEAISDKKVIAQEEQSDGTGDILEQLKKLKK